MSLSAAEKWEKLRGLSELFVQPKPRDFVSSEILPESLAWGGLTEITGPWGCGKTERVVRFLAEQRLRSAWIENDLNIYPPSFALLSAPLERILFVRAGGKVFWTAAQVLKSQLFQIVVLSTSFWPALELKRLQLAAEKAHAAIVLVSEKPIAQGRWYLAKALHLEGRK